MGLRASTFNILSERISMTVKHDYYESIINKDIAFFDSKRTGDLVSRLNSDIQVIQDTLGTNLSMFLRSSIFIITAIIILCFISPTLTAVMFGGILPAVIFSNFYMKWMRKLQMVI